MAKPSLELIQVIRRAARKLETSPNYQWGHMGACNCGFLAQEVTQLTKEEIHRRAMLGQGDWSEQLNDYCPANGLPFDDVISKLIGLGFDTTDLQHLERLSNPAILRALPPEKRNLMYNMRADVVLYMKMWAEQLEDELVKNITIPAIAKNASHRFADFI
jgi:hypothetical protein